MRDDPDYANTKLTPPRTIVAVASSGAPAGFVSGFKARSHAVKGYLTIAISLGAVGMALPGLAVASCNLPSSAFTILQNQPYALCAGAHSFIFDQIAYAKCLVHPSGNSISAPFSGLSTLNQQCTSSGSCTISTYSPPANATNPNGKVAVYTCNKAGSYAQCDGGFCFTGTSGTTFPDLGVIGPNHIVCSCPITTTIFSYQVFGPKPCPTTAADYDAICGAGTTASDDGATLYIGSPTGIPTKYAECLTGSAPTFNTCSRPLN